MSRPSLPILFLLSLAAPLVAVGAGCGADDTTGGSSGSPGSVVAGNTTDGGREAIDTPDRNVMCKPGDGGKCDKFSPDAAPLKKP